jgi:DNA-binding SARP family transcriptional activator
MVQLSRGRFLEGFSIRGSPEFSEWVLLQRETTDLKLRTALHNLVNALLSIDQWEQALSSLYHLLQLDPWDESAHRKVMALLASHHQRNAALSQYERCRSLLKDELGVEPDQETVQLYEQIRSGMLLERRDKGKDPFHLNPKSTPLTVKNYSHGQFVGREAEMAWLSASLDQALRENGRPALS